MINHIKKDFNTMTWVLIPVAIAINIAIGQIVVLLKLPVYLDSIGTVLVGVICGPWAGAVTGALSNTIWGFAIDPNALPWWPVAFFIGYMAGRMAIWGFFKSWWKVYLYGGITASGSSFITAYLLQTGQGVFQAVFSTSFLVEPVDKITTCMLAFAIVQGLSKRFIARFPRPENVEMEGGANQTQLYIAVGVVVVLVLFAAFMLRNILGG